jgi:HK97 family phage major capsid protein
MFKKGEEISLETLRESGMVFALLSEDETKAINLSDKLRKIESAVYEKLFPSRGMVDMAYPGYLVSVWDKYVIICKKDKEYYQVGYAEENGDYVFDPSADWKAVEQEWVLKTIQDAVESELEEEETKQGARHSAGDRGKLQSIHDAAVGLGAECGHEEKSEEKSESVLIFGEEVKALNDTGLIGGYLVKFTDAKNPDLDGDYFDKSTDFDLENSTDTTIYYNHGLDGTIKKRKLGRGKMEIRDVGVWVEAQLEMRDEYEKAIFGLVQKNKLGWSSGTLPNLVERQQVGKAYWVKSWPLGKDASLTPTPAAGLDHTQAVTLKFWAESSPDLESLTGLKTVQFNLAVDNKTEEKGEIENKTNANGGTYTMPIVLEKADRDQLVQDIVKEVKDAWKVEPVTQPKVEAKSEQPDTINDTLNKILKFIEDDPKLRRVGYLTDDGGSADPTHKSFGDFLIAVKRGDKKRLRTIYKSVKVDESDDPEVKDLMEDSGGAGGYLVPAEYVANLLQVAQMNNQVVNKVQVIPVSKPSGYWPSLDQFITPTAGVGNTAFAAGVTAAITAEGGALTETEPSFEMISWRVHKIGGFTQVSNELVSDSPQTIETLLTSLFGVAVGAKTEHYILRGNGVGQPLGILNAPALINITPSTNNLFSFIDAVTMQSRFKSVGGAPVWLMHPSVWPDITTMEIGTAGASAWVANMQASMGNSLNGYPFVQSEHLPQANNSGDVILADLSAYLLFRRNGLSIAFSEHVGFLNELGTWRFSQRQDGQPWLKNVITLADPQGSYTMSPFISHND